MVRNTVVNHISNWRNQNNFFQSEHEDNLTSFGQSANNSMSEEPSLSDHEPNEALNLDGYYKQYTFSMRKDK